MAVKKTVIIVAGPTASGKTSIALAAAKHFRTEIISADSRQCYRELRIGVARPSDQELEEVPHHFIGTHSIHEKITAAGFESFALAKVQELFVRHDTVVLAGGTGLYIKAFCEGLDSIPIVPQATRNEVIQEYEARGITWLQEELAEHDPEFYRSGEILNPHRLMRALEVLRATGQSILSFHSQTKAHRDFDTVKIALLLPREELYRRINNRVDQMMEQGLEAEARALIPYQHLHALQTVGYQELFDHFNGRSSLQEAVARIKQNTRQYAKRQITWFKKDPAYQWLAPDIVKEQWLGR